MDMSDKEFFTHMFGELSKRMDRSDKVDEDFRNEVKDHLDKTCTEIGGVDDKVIEIDKSVASISKDLKNHLDSSEKKSDRKFLAKINIPQWFVAVTAVIVAVYAVLN